MESSVVEPRLLVNRSTLLTWAAAALLPLPALVVPKDPSADVEIPCIYLGLASAWLTCEVVRAGGWPAGREAFRSKLATAAGMVLADVALFVAMGLAAGVRTPLPFPLMAALSATPAVGLVPALAVRLRQPMGAALLAAVLLLAAKLLACVAARIAYGPGFIEQGYVAADWRTAKLMISLFWGQVVVMSAVAAAIGGRGANGRS
jgi:hypothetical protein